MSLKNTSHVLEELKAALVAAFMNAPQLDARISARVPVDFVAPAQSARAQQIVNAQRNGTYLATTPQMPIASSSA